ncbi:hypothetical protein CAEBREN_24534 [Caenorhabditis brenneri]|uniref:Uncharacterized protein n=1 Tax=Caenorhabditis brenneri TaxID=135651 RepID=G0P6B6_CAEBE|nr:hypothetical protein CAEBREN_24534 [Caenorhabditis brenneri]
MKFQIVFLLALIGYSQAQGLPGVICGITGLLCPPTTAAPTTAPDIEEICFTIPGGNIDIVIDPTQLTQTEIDEIKRLLEDSLSNVLGSLGSSINGTLNSLVGGLTGLLNPATTPVPTGNGQICVVIHNSDVNQLQAFLDFYIVRMNRFLQCINERLPTLIDQDLASAQFWLEFDRIGDELYDMRNKLTNCDEINCYIGVMRQLYSLVLSIPDRLWDMSKNIREGVNQCATGAINA